MMPLDDEDRAAALDGFNPDQVDAEFLPYLDEINSFAFVVTAQCCAGHLDYEDYAIPMDLRPSLSTRWGYLQLLLTFEAAEWLCETARDWPWLWVEGSQAWIDGAALPGTTENGSCVLAFAWDAREWPACIEDVVAALRSFGESGN